MRTGSVSKAASRLRPVTILLIALAAPAASLPASAAQPATLVLQADGREVRSEVTVEGLPEAPSSPGDAGSPGSRIEASSIDSRTALGASAPTPSAKSYATARRVHAPIRFTKRADAASTRLQQAHQSGELLELLRLELRSASGQRTIATLSNVKVASYQTSDTGAVPTEQVSITYTEIKWQPPEPRPSP